MSYRLFIIFAFISSYTLHVKCSGIFEDNGFILDDYISFVIPTVKSNNVKCRNHSIFYMEELKKLKLWATEMFDSSSKIPTGILSGVNYNFGNFDECVDVSVTLNDGDQLNGKHCMANFHFSPPEHVKKNRRFHYQYYEYDNFINTSVWEKVADFYNDRTRTSRNEIYYSFCIPSSCSHEDLQQSLKEIFDQFNFQHFQISISVDPLHCQTKSRTELSIADITFISIVAVFMFLVIAATAYQWLTECSELENYRLRKIPHQIILAFSLKANIASLGKDSNNDEGLACINGMKVVSMFLIIMGHRIMFGIGSPIMNPNYIESMYGRVEATILLNGPIIVDTFFNIGGFLACYLMLQKFHRIKSIWTIVILYLHRFIRLTPIYALMIGFYCTVFIKLGSGPLWKERMLVEQERCLNSWWTNILYVNNYINKEHLCMFQSWYLACDMQLFILTPLFVWLLYKKPFLGVTSLCAAIIASICVVFSVVYVNKEDGILLLYKKLLRNPVAATTFQNVYIPTHMRSSPYFVGMLTGYFKYRLQEKDYKLPNYVVYIGWFCGLIMIEFTIYSAFIFYIPEKPYNPLLSAIYASTHHFVFSLCISWVIVTVSEGYGSWIKSVLSWKAFALMSRITYSAFLVHGAIQLYSSAIMRQPMYGEIFYVLFHSVGDIGLAYMIGFLLSLFFESPIIKLEKLIFEPEKSTKK